MTEKGAAGLSILVILLLWAAHAAYGYWTDQVGVREEFAVVWPLEVEIETEADTEAEAGDAEVDTGLSADTDGAEENEIVNESAAAEGGTDSRREDAAGEKEAEDGQPL